MRRDAAGQPLRKWNDLTAAERLHLERGWSPYGTFVGYGGRAITGYLRHPPSESVHGRAATRRRTQAARAAAKAGRA